MHGNQISVVNLTLTKDNRLVDKGHIEKHKTLRNAPTQRRLYMEQLVNKARTLGMVQSIEDSYLIR